MTRLGSEPLSGDWTNYAAAAASEQGLHQSENLTSKKSLIRRLTKGRDARTRFVESHLSKKLALQIRALRGDLSQEQMQGKVGIKQQVLSRLENPSYGKATLTTLKKIAAGCDVALLVEFVPYSELVNRVSGTPYVERGFSTDTFNLPSFEKEADENAFEPAPLNRGFVSQREDAQQGSPLSPEDNVTEIRWLNFSDNPQRRWSTFSYPPPIQEEGYGSDYQMIWGSTQ